MFQEMPFDELVARLRSGEDEAARAVHAQFVNRLIGLANNHLSAAVRARVDAEDIVQSVFKSFFRRHAERPFLADSWDALWAILSVIAVRKCNRRQRYERAAKRDARREVLPPVEDSAWETADREPTPAEAAELADQMARLLGRFDPADRLILELRLAKYEVKEIAQMTGRSQSAVYGVLAKLRQLTQELYEEA